MTFKYFFVLVYFCLVVINADAQNQGRRQTDRPASAVTATVSATDKITTTGIPLLSKFLKPETSVMNGMTPSFNQDSRFYLAVPDSLLGRDILLVTRISKSAAAVRRENFGYAGDQISQDVFRFMKSADGKIQIRKLVLRERVKDSLSSMYQNLKRSSVLPIIATFEVKAISDDGKTSAIDVTDFFNSDSDFLFFSSGVKKLLSLGGMLSDRSNMVSMRSYPINTEISVQKTYANSDGGDPATFEINVSLVLLPEKPMVSRYGDERVGYFNVRYFDYSKNPQGVADGSIITRWRLEPKPEDMEKYKRGELVEPAKPIVYYIDPSTPKEWVPYLIQGVNDWQKAFEKAGFKNAIIGKVAPTKEEDPTWSLEDARYSAIVYKPSNIPNANGPQINDPRSGEIIESHINWFHNIMSLAHNWYFVQCAAVDTGAQKMLFDTELMGQLVRFVSSHEVGHTLGLRHNFGGTAIYTTEQIRDPKFLAENGHTTSIMDYSRFNFVAQPEDNIPRELLFPRISHYDSWAIEWGYRRFYQFDDPDKEQSFINKWIIERTKDRRLFYGREFNESDPRNQSEDLTNNQMKANELAIKNLKVIMSHLIEWTKEDNADYTNLRDMHEQIVNQYNRYLLHVAKWIGGVYEEIKTVEQPGPAYTYTEKERQQEAIAFLNRNLLDSPPTWIVPKDVLKKIAQNPLNTIEKFYTEVFFKMLSYRVVQNLIVAEMEMGSKAYTVNDLFNDLNKSVWKSLSANISPDAYARSMQKVYVRVLGNLYTSENGIVSFGNTKGTSVGNDPTDVRSLAYFQLITLKAKLAAAKSQDMVVNAHYRYLVSCIDNILEKVKMGK